MISINEEDLRKLKLHVLATTCEVYDLAVSDYVCSKHSSMSQDDQESLADRMRTEIVTYLKSKL